MESKCVLAWGDTKTNEQNGQSMRRHRAKGKLQPALGVEDVPLPRAWGRSASLVDAVSTKT